MIFLYETKKNGIVSYDANIVNGELKIQPFSEFIPGKREEKDIIAVARTLLATEGKFEDGKTDLRNYK